VPHWYQFSLRCARAIACRGLTGQLCDWVRASAPTVALVLAQGARAAEPSDYVLAPNVVYGEREIDLKAGSFSGPGPRDSAGSVALGLSPTTYWLTELYAAYARPRGAGTRFDAIEWENRFQLTDPGQYAIDWVAWSRWKKPHEAGSGWNLTLGPLMQGELADRFEWNFNPLLSRNLAGPAGARTNLAYQAQLKYRHRKSFEFGVQGFGDLGAVVPLVVTGAADASVRSGHLRQSGAGRPSGAGVQRRLAVRARAGRAFRYAARASRA